MNKAIIFLGLLALTFANIDQFSSPGGWQSYKISTGFQADPTNPLTKIYTKLTDNLQENGVSDIQFTSAQSQLVNGMNFKIQFAYTQGTTIKKGTCLAYVSFSGETVEIHEVELQKQSLRQEKYGDWNSYPIPKGFEQDPTSPLNKVMGELAKELSKLSARFVKFVNIQYQIVAGLKFKVQFQYLSNNGMVDVGTCTAYVREWENFVQIQELSVKAPLSLQAEDEDHKEGGWETYKYDANELQNGTSAFSFAYNMLQSTLEKKSVKLVSISSVQSQIVSGLNFKIFFVYSENNSLKMGSTTIYVQSWTNTVKVTQFELSGQVIHY